MRPNKAKKTGCSETETHVENQSQNKEIMESMDGQVDTAGESDNEEIGSVETDQASQILKAISGMEKRLNARMD